MSRWFRVDDGLVDDPKVQQLPDRLFRAVVNLWCITSQNDGNFPTIEQVAFKLRMTVPKAERVLDDLRAAGLIDDDETGTRPHNWNGRQFKSDVSTSRVQRFRERQRNVSSAVSETPPETETETETEQRQIRKDIRAVASATRPTDDDFEEFWKAYPRRKGANPKAPARKLFDAAVKQGADPKAIVAGALRCAEQDRDKIGTEYIPQGVKWLRDRRWEDYLSGAEADNKRIADAERELAAKGWFKNSETNQWEHRGQP